MNENVRKILYLIMCYIISLVVTLIAKLFGFVGGNIFLYALSLTIGLMVIDVIRFFINRKIARDRKRRRKLNNKS